MKDSIHKFVYAAVMGIVCSMLLTSAGRFAAPYREANEKAERVSNILRVLGVQVSPDARAAELLELFEARVEVKESPSLTMYVSRDEDDTVQAVAVPFSGPGLWGPIDGILSLESDMKTIRGVSFYKHEETPGLGGEIASQWFQNQFKGKSIEASDGVPGMKVLPGASAANEVDAITGATMTCDKVEAMLNAVIVKIVKERANNE